MSDLTDFLLARIADDERAATDEAIARVRAGTVVGGPGVSAQSVEQVQEGLRDLHRVRPWSSPSDPARVLAECDAKRRIVTSRPAIGVEGAAIHVVHEEVTRQREYVFRLLALPYAGHPDYREEWRP